MSRVSRPCQAQGTGTHSLPPTRLSTHLCGMDKDFDQLLYPVHALLHGMSLDELWLSPLSAWNGHRLLHRGHGT